MPALAELVAQFRDPSGRHPSGRPATAGSCTTDPGQNPMSCHVGNRPVHAGCGSEPVGLHLHLRRCVTARGRRRAGRADGRVHRLPEPLPGTGRQPAAGPGVHPRGDQPGGDPGDHQHHDLHVRVDCDDPTVDHHHQQDQEGGDRRLRRLRRRDPRQLRPSPTRSTRSRPTGSPSATASASPASRPPDRRPAPVTRPAGRSRPGRSTGAVSRSRRAVAEWGVADDDVRDGVDERAGAGLEPAHLSQVGPDVPGEVGVDERVEFLGVSCGRRAAGAKQVRKRIRARSPGTWRLRRLRALRRCSPAA